MKKLAVTLAFCVTATVGNSAEVLFPNGDFSSGAAGWSSFASGGTAISFPADGGAGGIGDGIGIVDNTAGAWGGGLVSPADFEFAGNNGIPLASLGLVAGSTYTFSIDMINLASTGLGGVKFESWGDDQGGPGIPAIVSNSGDLAASGQSASWATYSWNYTIDASADAIKIVPLLTPPTYGVGDGQSSIGFDNIRVENIAVPEPTSSILLGLGTLGLMVRRRR